MKNQYLLGVDLGGTNLKIGIVNQRFSILEKANLDTKRFCGKHDLIDAFVAFVRDILKKHARVKGIGIGVPGPVDFRSGLVHSVTNIAGWKDVPLKRMLERRLAIPVAVDNDAKVMTLAEQRMGAAKGYSTVVCMTLGTGVGGGIIIDGRLYRGRDNAAGEIGHIPVNDSGPRCNCGGMACLERYVGNAAILKEAQRVFHTAVTLEETSRMANVSRNPKAVRLWQSVGRHVGVALSGIINVLNPQCIVIGGGVAKAGAVLFRSIRSTVEERAMRVQRAHLKIVPASLGENAGIIGAAILASEER